MATNINPSTRADYTSADRESPDSMAGLVRRLFDEVSTLFRQEIALATTELSRSITSAKRGIASVAAGGAVLFAGFLALLGAAILALSKVMEPWLASLVVGFVVGIVGYIMLSAGRKKLEPAAFKPVHTQESLRRDKEMLTERNA